MTRVVVDTSVLIRYLIRPSAAIQELIEVRWLDGQIQMVTAPELVAELADVLQRRDIQALIHAEEGQVLLDAIHQLADMIPPLGRIPSYTRDPKDDKVIACALAGRAQYVITTDEDLLTLGTLADVRIMSPVEFIALLRRAAR